MDIIFSSEIFLLLQKLILVDTRIWVDDQFLLLNSNYSVYRPHHSIRFFKEYSNLPFAFSLIVNIFVGERLKQVCSDGGFSCEGNIFVLKTSRVHMPKEEINNV